MIRVIKSSATRLQEASGQNHNGVADLHDAAARWRAPDVGSARSEFSNVVLLSRARRDATATPAPELSAAARPTVVAAQPHRALWWVALLLASTAAHVALYLPFGREPVPMSSLGEVAVSVELVLGANQDAGLIPDKGTAEASAPAPAQAPDAVPEQQPEPPATQVAKIEPETQRPDLPPVAETAKVEPTPEQPQTPVEIAQVQAEPPQEPPTPAQVVEKTEPVEKPPEQVAALPAEQEPSPPQPIAPVKSAPEPPAPAQVQAAPQATVAPAAELQAAINPETPATVTVVPPRETAKPAVPPPPKPQAKPALKKPEAKPPVVREKRKSETRRAAVRGESNNSRTTSPASTAAGGAGRGRSQANSNYSGQVHAHLRRYLRYPEEARSRGERGTASVSFTVDAGGRVTSVRLARGVGSAALDREAVAVVRRASPFPAPPGGRGHSFTAPVGFNLN